MTVNEIFLNKTKVQLRVSHIEDDTLIEMYIKTAYKEIWNYFLKQTDEDIFPDDVVFENLPDNIQAAIIHLTNHYYSNPDSTVQTKHNVINSRVIESLIGSDRKYR